MYRTYTLKTLNLVTFAVLFLLLTSCSTDSLDEVSCDNDLLDGQKTDIDCGGPVCRPCALGKFCKLDSDCLSDHCKQGFCAKIIDPCSEIDCSGHGKCTITTEGDPVCTCDNGYQADGHTCVLDDSSCKNDKIDGKESDVDCGGPTCPACELAKICKFDSDCQSKYCENGRCIDPCNNDKIDGQETDVDCGGPTCPACALDKNCKIDSDCQSQYCENGRCIDPCSEVDCSEHGRCSVNKERQPECICDSGYKPDGLSCVLVVVAMAGGVDKTAVWADFNFPLVPQSRSRVGNAGGKYHYYQFNVGNDKYVGAIAFGPAPFSGNALFNVWISEQPGHAAITKGNCHSPTFGNSLMRYVTNLPEAEERNYCKLTPGTYYVNIADGIDALSGVTASSEGNCSLPDGCAYYLETTATKK